MQSLSLFVLLVINAGVNTEDPDLVHFGDVKLEPLPPSQGDDPDSVTGILWVYYRRDFQVPAWRKVCAKDFVDPVAGGTAICKMLSYEIGKYAPHNMPPNADDDFALTELDCTKAQSNGAPPNHLLRCGHVPYTELPTKCPQPVILECSNHLGYPLVKDTNAYEGQVQLCPPDQISNDSNPRIQVSMGIVSVFENNLWGSLNEKTQPLTHQQANSICRHLGFTGAVVDSARTVGSLNGSMYTFTKCHEHVIASYTSSHVGLHGTWLTVQDSMECDHACPCFSCCYERPLGPICLPLHMSDGECDPEHCCAENDLVIECTFDKTLQTPPMSGSEATCSDVKKDSTLSVCAEDNQQQVLIMIGALVPSLFAVGFFTALIVVSVYTYQLKRRHNGYRAVPGENHVGHGNGIRNGINGNGNGNGNGHEN